MGESPHYIYIYIYIHTHLNICISGTGATVEDDVAVGEEGDGVEHLCGRGCAALGTWAESGGVRTGPEDMDLSMRARARIWGAAVRIGVQLV